MENEDWTDWRVERRLRANESPFGEVAFVESRCLRAGQVLQTRVTYLNGNVATGHNGVFGRGWPGCWCSGQHEHECQHNDLRDEDAQIDADADALLDAQQAQIPEGWA